MLINQSNIDIMSVKNSDDFNVKRLLNNPNLTQSQSICFGTVFENFVKNLITNKGLSLREEKLVDVRLTGTTTNKGKKDIDISFVKDGVVYYFECKLNLDLDSEKSKATDDKVGLIREFIQSENPDRNVKSGVLTGWYEMEKGLPNKLKSQVFFMKDLFSILGYEITKEEYYQMMSEFGSMI